MNKLTKIPYKQQSPSKKIKTVDALMLETQARITQKREYVRTRLKKSIRSQWHVLLEDHILTALEIIRAMSENVKNSKDKKVKITGTYAIFIELYNFIDQFLEIAGLNDLLTDTCAVMAELSTRRLMDHVYKLPKGHANTNCFIDRIEMPMLFSPWESAKEMKRKFDETAERVGLATGYSIKSKSRFSSVPTMVVIKLYTQAMSADKFNDQARLSVRRFPLGITKDNFSELWKCLKQSLVLKFNELQGQYPAYYRTLRDERGDNTPVYIKRKLWMQACKQALKGIASHAVSSATDGTIKPPRINRTAYRVE